MTDRQASNRLVFLHGFTQTHHHWHRGAHAIARRIGSTPTLVFVDLPGHGLSAADTLDIVDAVTALPALAGPGTWIGYSMGGRHALLAAASGAPEVERLVLIGATAGIVDDDARADRADLDRARADALISAGVDAFLDDWLAAPMFADLPDDPDDVAHRRRNTAQGLAHSLRTAGTGVQPSVWDDLARIEIPVLVIAGERDAKFTEIGRRLVAALPHGTFAAIGDAGHAAQTERPADTTSIIVDWLT